jgi:CobQ-like glutamine amidotransferase family enzyme
MRLRACALYPDLMNIYADRGNLIVLERRCAWRGIAFELSRSGLGEALDGEAHDLYYLGGGQDRDQRLCAADLLERKAAGLARAAARGAIVLGVCGGYQLLGHSYELAPGETLAGVGLLDVRTVREPGPRLIGNIAIDPDLGPDGRVAPSASEGAPARAEEAARGAQSEGELLAGFENHGGRTRLGAGARPLGRVVRGHGNDGTSGFEGARRANVIGTYLHGPLLPKNAWFADWLIATALGVPPASLEPLEDELEVQAHRSALRAAGVRA